MSRHAGKVATLNKIRDQGASFEAEISTGRLSLLERQRILGTTSSGESAGRLPVGHRDDSQGRFAGGDSEPRTIVFRPDESITPEEQAALTLSQRLGHEQAAKDLHCTPRQLRTRIESANRKAMKRATRAAAEAEELRRAIEAGDEHEEE